MTLAALALAAPASSAGPGLPYGYDFKRIESPNPLNGGAFGWGVASADVTGDGEADLIVAQAQTGAGQVFIFDGVTGGHIDTIDPPEQNPSPGTETLAFVYVETMPDLGSCPGGDGADADEICDDSKVGPGDGIPEIITGSRNLKVNSTDGAAAPVAGDPNIGRAYVFDGATRVVLKRIDMPQGDRMAQQTLEASPQFGRLVLSLQATPPCAGDPGENNGVGVGPCGSDSVHVRTGDVDGSFDSGPDDVDAPDLLITARNFVETGAQAAAGSQCRTTNASRCTSGKAWVYRGEDIVRSDPRSILENPIYSIQNPESQTGGAEFGGNAVRVGDVLAVNPDNNNVVAGADGAPEFVIAARTLDYPLKAPDATLQNVGAAFLYNGRDGRRFSTIVSPEPQPRSQFSASFNFGRPTGDLGASLNPDIMLGAPLQNAHSTDDGKVWVFNAVGGGGGAEGSWQFASLTDPNPVVGGNFGGGTTGVGDLVTSVDAPANEVLVGGFRFDPFTEAARRVPDDLHIVNPTMEKTLQTIGHPEGVTGDGFGVGLTPMGDLNDDGFLDFGVSAYLANVKVSEDCCAGAGLAYILTSNNTPPPPAPTPTPTPTASPSPQPPPSPTPAPLAAGPCANQKLGTEAGETLDGTIAGDNLLAQGGADFVHGFQGDDCIDGGNGNDRLDGGADADKIVGGEGSDRIVGRDGRDRLYGTIGNDFLSGGYGLDVLAGGSGRDRLLGGPERDRLFGEGGKDRLVGGGGRDRVDGGRGNDSIDVRDGGFDRVLCGPGRDRVRADRRDSLNACERVSRKRRR